MSILKLVLKAAAPLPDIEKSERYLFIGPHPDDIEIGAGATAAKLAAMGLKVYLPGGRLKPSTQALVGTEAVQNLSCYNFTKGFFGANGISSTAGFSTPDFSESKVKTEAMHRCRKSFVLADSSKFKRVFPITFARLPEADIITDVLPDSKYKKLTNIIEVGEEK